VHEHGLCILHRRLEADDIEVGVLKTAMWNFPDSYLTDALSYALQGIRGAEILSVRVHELRLTWKLFGNWFTACWESCS
jgi:hypothetical protein